MNCRKELPVLSALLGFVIVLSAIYLHSQPYRYYESTAILLNSLHLEEARSVATIDDMKDWFFGLREAVAPKSSDAIDINCALNASNTDGSTYCRYHDLIQQEFTSTPVTIGNGYFEVIQFSLLVRRGESPTFPDDMFDDPKQSLAKTRTDSASSNEDPQVITVMYLDNGNFTCVLEDGFKGDFGSTLHWDGVLIEGKYAFDSESVIHVHTPYNAWQTYQPCFSYVNNTVTGTYDLEFGPGHPSHGTGASALTYDFEGATFDGFFLTTAHYVRRKCLEYDTPEPTAHQNFITALSRLYVNDTTASFNTFSDTLDYLFSCSTLTAENVTFEYLDARFLHDPDVTRVEIDGAYGNFFDTSSEYLWQVESAATIIKLDMLGVFDTVRQSLKLYVTLRNVQEDRLFYSMISADFSLPTSGKVSLDVEIAYVPIVQYYYGTDDYPLVFFSWIVADLLIILLWLRTTVKIAHNVCYSTRKVTHKVISKVQEKARHCHVMKSVNNNAAATLDYSPTHSSADMDLDLYLSSCENSENGSNISAPDGLNLSFIEGAGSGVDRGSDLESDDVRKESWIKLAAVFSLSMVLDITLAFLLSLYISSRAAWYFIYSDLHEHIVNLPTGLDVDYYRSPDYISTLVKKTDYIILREGNGRYLAFFLVVDAMVVFFAVLSQSRKFNIVTLSIYRSMKKIWPTLFVLLVFLLAYAILGSMLYGSIVAGWSNIYGAFVNLFIMLLGDYAAYDDIKKLYPVLTALYFWTFLIIVYFVIFNVALAIILDAYAEVNEESRAYRAKKQLKKRNKDK